jgi:hypothetical protein
MEVGTLQIDAIGKFIYAENLMDGLARVSAYTNLITWNDVPVFYTVFDAYGLRDGVEPCLSILEVFWDREKVSEISRPWRDSSGSLDLYTGK